MRTRMVDLQRKLLHIFVKEIYFQSSLLIPLSDKEEVDMEDPDKEKRLLPDVATRFSITKELVINHVRELDEIPLEATLKNVLANVDKICESKFGDLNDDIKIPVIWEVFL